MKSAPPVTPGPESPFGFRQKLARMLWGVCQATLYAWSPRPFHGWRCFLLRLFGAKVGVGVHPYPGLKIWAPWNIVIGNNVGMADGAVLYSMDKITIGDRSIVSQDSYICCGTHNFSHRAYPLVTKPVVVGQDCWIASRVFVHPGVTIPDGVVVGACSVVVRALPEWSVCAGNPCVKIKDRSYDNNEN